eukprot:g51780.t1
MLGFTVLAFPSREFGQQEFAEPAKIKQFVQQRFPSCSFPLFSLVHVKPGPDLHPAYKFLLTSFPGDITWNFGSKFLIGRAGQPLARFDKNSWEEIEAAIQQALKEEPSQAKL